MKRGHLSRHGRLFAAVWLAMGAVGCAEKSGAATVIAKEKVPGTAADAEHAAQPDRWLVKVQMVADLRIVSVDVEQPRWDGIKIGDRMKVRYSVGKYTGTIWGSEFQ